MRKTESILQIVMFSLFSGLLLYGGLYWITGRCSIMDGVRTQIVSHMELNYCLLYFLLIIFEWLRRYHRVTFSPTKIEKFTGSRLITWAFLLVVLWIAQIPGEVALFSTIFIYIPDFPINSTDEDRCKRWVARCASLVFFAVLWEVLLGARKLQNCWYQIVINNLEGVTDTFCFSGAFYISVCVAVVLLCFTNQVYSWWIKREIVWSNMIRLRNETGVFAGMLAVVIVLSDSCLRGEGYLMAIAPIIIYFALYLPLYENIRINGVKRVEYLHLYGAVLLNRLSIVFTTVILLFGVQYSTWTWREFVISVLPWLKDGTVMDFSELSVFSLGWFYYIGAILFRGIERGTLYIEPVMKYIFSISVMSFLLLFFITFEICYRKKSYYPMYIEKVVQYISYVSFSFVFYMGQYLLYEYLDECFPYIGHVIVLVLNIGLLWWINYKYFRYKYKSKDFIFIK